MQDGGFGQDSVEVEEHGIEPGQINGMWAEWLFSGEALCHLQASCESLGVSTSELDRHFYMLPFCSPEM